MKINRISVYFIVGIICLCRADSNDNNDDEIPSGKEKSLFRNLVKPFRMEKLNLIWVKAQQRLTEPKLQSLYTQMKIQDKEELQYKQNHKETDKDGSEAAKLRDKLSGIMKNYNLLEFDDDYTKYGKPIKYDKYSKDKHEHYANKVGLFKDKKLNRLWSKAEYAGFTADELNDLKIEFEQYQTKVEDYYNKLDGKIKKRYDNAVNQDELEIFNEVIPDEEIKDTQREHIENTNQLREKHRELKDLYENLERKTAQGRTRREFVDPKVIDLWNTALENNFTAQELAELKEELFHFEAKLLKLSHLYAEHAMNNEKFKHKKDKKASEKMENLDKHLKKQARKVEKLQEDLEKQINRHTEL